MPSNDLQLKDTEFDKNKNNEVFYQLETTLHSLIGILIRYESEMCITDDTFSLRNLNNEN